MKLKIESIFDVNLPGVDVFVPKPEDAFCEDYFECRFYPEPNRGDCVVDWLVTREAEVKFDRIETHSVPEVAYFLTGTAIMPFAQMRDGKVDLSTMHIVRIPAGTQITIGPGVPHYVPMAADGETVHAMYVHPACEAPKAPIGEMVWGE